MFKANVQIIQHLYDMLEKLICCCEVKVGIGAFTRDSSAAVAALGLESEWRDPLATPLHPWVIFSGGAYKVDTPPTCLHTDLLGFDTLQTYHHRRTALGPSFTFLFECLICCTKGQDAGPSGGNEYVAPHYEAMGSYRHSQGRKFGLTRSCFPDTNAGERQTGRRAQLSNISAAKM